MVPPPNTHTTNGRTALKDMRVFFKMLRRVIAGRARLRGYPLYKPDLAVFSRDDFADVRQMVQSARDGIEKPQNPSFFENLKTYNYQNLAWLLMYRAPAVLSQIPLYVPNILVLEFLASHPDVHTLVDYPAGFGNLFSFIGKLRPDIECFGVDNFSQIARNIVEEFQAATARRPVGSFEEIRELLNGRAVDCVPVISLPTEWILANLQKLSPRYLLLEDRYTTDQDITELEKGGYRILGQNPIMLYLEKADSA